MTKKLALIGGFALLALIAVAGWVRKTTIAPPDPNYLNPPTATLAPAAPSALAAPAASNLASSEQRPAAPRHVVAHRTSAQTHHRSVVTHKRPLSHSAAIVAGSAGAGAAIGALAGGGKGAAIGALAGGAGGFIYDRATHKKTTVVEE